VEESLIPGRKNWRGVYNSCRSNGGRICGLLKKMEISSPSKGKGLKRSRAVDWRDCQKDHLGMKFDLLVEDGERTANRRKKCLFTGGTGLMNRESVTFWRLDDPLEEGGGYR